MTITVENIKSHCRIDGTDEDELLAGYIAAATDLVSSITGVDFSEDAEEPAPVRAIQAVRVLVAHWYANREAASDAAPKTVPLAFEMLVASLQSGLA